MEKSFPITFCSQLLFDSALYLLVPTLWDGAIRLPTTFNAPDEASAPRTPLPEPSHLRV